MDQFTLGLDPLPKKTRKEVFLDEMNQVVLPGRGQARRDTRQQDAMACGDAPRQALCA